MDTTLTVHVPYLDAAAVLGELISIADTDEFWLPTAAALGDSHTAAEVRARVAVLTLTDPQALALQVSGNDLDETTATTNAVLANFTERAPAKLPDPWPGRVSITVTTGPVQVSQRSRGFYLILIGSAATLAGTLTAIWWSKRRSRAQQKTP